LWDPFFNSLKDKDVTAVLVKFVLLLLLLANKINKATIPSLPPPPVQRWAKRMRLDEKFPLKDGKLGISSPGVYYVYAQVS
jgi:hypothetical protein